MILEKDRVRFLAFDCIVINGQYIGDKPLNKRLGVLLNEIVAPFHLMCVARGSSYTQEIAFE
jgi:ATP-dependent DNA ligase